ncbi:hypothetical protein VTL71DRAFT_4504 [Oculimacula yallundae]|uniref:Uncharacterized protein n=1 Tax=Oculimacula yallundae TaxID=86028 RepID=A0ABR4C287_9HELO
MNTPGSNAEYIMSYAAVHCHYCVTPERRSRIQACLGLSMPCHPDLTAPPMFSVDLKSVQVRNAVTILSSYASTI